MTTSERVLAIGAIMRGDMEWTNVASYETRGFSATLRMFDTGEMVLTLRDVGGIKPEVSDAWALAVGAINPVWTVANGATFREAKWQAGA